MPSFASQLDIDELNAVTPVRVMAVHRDRIHVAGPGLDTLIPPFADTAGDEEATATVGDWLLLDAGTTRPRRLLRRASLFKRRAAGTSRKLQLIAANVDTLFIVSSCNQDFNAARLERYLALAREAEVTPVIVLTKADLADAPEDYVQRGGQSRAQAFWSSWSNARSAESVARLAPWCARGQTVALVGSSGVGKSTLVNTLTGSDRIATQGIREDDDKGRHTTIRARAASPAGRRLAGRYAGHSRVADHRREGRRRRGVRRYRRAGGRAAASPIAATRREPGCAVRAAIEAGRSTPAASQRWRKLAAEEAHNTISLAERRDARPRLRQDGQARHEGQAVATPARVKGSSIT